MALLPALTDLGERIVQKVTSASQLTCNLKPQQLLQLVLPWQELSSLAEEEVDRSTIPEDGRASSHQGKRR